MEKLKPPQKNGNLRDLRAYRSLTEDNDDYIARISGFIDLFVFFF